MPLQGLTLSCDSFHSSNGSFFLLAIASASCFIKFQSPKREPNVWDAVVQHNTTGLDG